MEGGRFLPPDTFSTVRATLCGTTFTLKLGKVAEKIHVKSLIFCQTRGGGHPEPNSIFEEEKRGFSGTIALGTSWHFCQVTKTYKKIQ